MSEEAVKRGRGRPKKDGGYDRRVELRMSADDVTMLEILEKKMGCTKSDLIRAWLRSNFTFMRELESDGR